MVRGAHWSHGLSGPFAKAQGAPRSSSCVVCGGSPCIPPPAQALVPQEVTWESRVPDGGGGSRVQPPMAPCPTQALWGLCPLNCLAQLRSGVQSIPVRARLGAPAAWGRGLGVSSGGCRHVAMWFPSVARPSLCFQGGNRFPRVSQPPPHRQFGNSSWPRGAAPSPRDGWQHLPPPPPPPPRRLHPYRLGYPRCLRAVPRAPGPGAGAVGLCELRVSPTPRLSRGHAPPPRSQGTANASGPEGWPGGAPHAFPCGFLGPQAEEDLMVRKGEQGSGWQVRATVGNSKEAPNRGWRRPAPRAKPKA